MAATIIGRRDPEPVDYEQRDKLAKSEPEKAWIIVTIVVGTLVAVAVIVLFAIRTLKRRDYREAKAHDPQITRQEFSRRRKLSEVDRMAEQEEQRRIMIRKSLASRDSTWSGRQGSISSQQPLAPGGTLVSYPEMVQVQVHRPDSDSDTDTEEEAESGKLQKQRQRQSHGSASPPSSRPGRKGLRDDWKEFEARIHRERSNSGELHPASNRRREDLPLVPTRTITRSRSPSQSSVVSQTMPSLPTITSSPTTETPLHSGQGTGGAGRESPLLRIKIQET